jgi:hypothetical protein
MCCLVNIVFRQAEEQAKQDQRNRREAEWQAKEAMLPPSINGGSLERGAHKGRDGPDRRRREKVPTRQAAERWQQP